MRDKLQIHADFARWWTLIDLIIFALLSFLQWGSQAFMMTWTARRLRSRNARLRNGIAVTLLFTGMAVAGAVLRASVSSERRDIRGAVSVAILVGSVVIGIAVLKRTFELRISQSLMVAAAVVATGFCWVAFSVLIVKPFVCEAFVTNQVAMVPTLIPGDRFAMSKLVNPARWDLVGYHIREHGSVVYCKRLLGLPGERIRFSGGNLFVNEHAVDAPSVLRGRLHAQSPMWPASLGRYRDDETIVLPKDEYFVIGDNVDVSADSRIAGPIEKGDVVGVVDALYWPIGRAHFLR